MTRSGTLVAAVAALVAVVVLVLRLGDGGSRGGTVEGAGARDAAAVEPDGGPVPVAPRRDARSAAEPGDVGSEEFASGAVAEPAAAPASGHLRVVGRVDPGPHDASDFVAALVAAPYDRPRRGPVPSVRVGADGRFAVDAQAPGAHALVVGARRASGAVVRPVTRFVDVAPDVAVDVGLLAPDAGFAIAGTTVDSGGAPVAGTAVFGHPVDVPGPSVLVDGGTLVWSGSGFERTSLQARAGPDGRFTAGGLAPGRYRIAAHAFRAPVDGIPYATAGQPEEQVEVTAPADGVVLVARGRSIRFRVTGGGLPVKAQIRILVEDDSFWTLQTNDEGLAQVELQGPGGLDLEFSAPSFEPRAESFAEDALTDGAEVAVDLEPGPPPAELAVRLDAVIEAALGDRSLNVVAVRRGRVSDGVVEALVGLQPAFGGDRGVVVLFPSSVSDAVVVREPGLVVAGPFEPGAYVVRLVPGTAGPDDDGAFLVDEPLEVEMRSGARTWIDWRPHLGGRVRLVATGAAAAEVRVELVGPDGEPRHPRWRFELDGQTVTSSAPALPGTSAALSPLEPGPYRLDVRVGGAARPPVPVDVRAGETALVELDLGEL